MSPPTPSLAFARNDFLYSSIYNINYNNINYNPISKIINGYLTIKEKKDKKKESFKIKIPEFIDLKIWEQFKKRRVKLKKPLTTFDTEIIIKDLTSFESKKKGSANISLIRSIEKGWKGVFPVKEYHQSMSQHNSSKNLSKSEKTALAFDNFEENYLLTTKK